MAKVASVFFGLFLLLSIGATGQMVFNGDLEYWEAQDPNSSFLLNENPKGWTTRNHLNQNPQAVYCLKTTDSYSGQRAAILKNFIGSNGLSLSSFLSLGNFDKNNSKRRGVAFTHRPYSFHFAYKYFTEDLDPNGFYRSGANIELSKWDETTGKRKIIGKGDFTIINKVSFYEEAVVVIDYLSNEEPDSMRIVFQTSSNPEDDVRLTVDDIYLQMDDVTTGNDDKLYVDEVNVFPNPVNDWLSFVNPLDIENASLLVYNSIGQLQMEEPIVGTGGKIDCQRLNAGMYFYQIRHSDELVKAGKIFKQ